MKQILYSLALVAMAFPAQAACYVDYKAKRDDPLKLHYGVMELPDSACTNSSNAREQVAARLARHGWVLLNVVSQFDTDGLAERKDSAGQYFLRY
ncbi:hypothetical protein XMM379_002768 [Aliiroseovarius sp. xm-m-379]|uniref:DUF4177 domain-containing protein n=1 Tax=Aliiroseovarius crassostreae TaxID=154981 RepID=A0A0N8IAY5_9RHOB|nr:MULTISPECIES: hypothetical protein [Aliiroseovarius]KPN61603.1 hypothetical protein AKJ29_03020 [Aliiroseovarius crassostreae]NRP26062.1 hypothetical protein [Aliiroseovarius sp. xm-m-379]NRP30429.1 hypothetical protein [Aliiroseovarius sp. xm-m-314]NRP34861.1 hypothetical protein [Aliiroseovarius sp. xm-a-104]NRP42859.1 hypothetical protein [Aliiroseovarius sp. xm-m-378]